jgi:hypothetical protein
MWVWAYRTINSCWPEMDIDLLLLPAVFMVIPVLYTLLPQVRMRAHWRLQAFCIACLKAWMIAWLIAWLRELHFEWSRVFHRKLLADGKF